jgi:hypothetical protein
MGDAWDDETNPLEDLGTFTYEEDPGARTWMVAAGVASVAASILLLLASAVTANLAGYVLGAIVPITIVAFYRRHSQARLAKVGVALSRLRSVATTALVVVGFIVASAHAWFIAKALA